MSDAPVLIAHRGYASRAPENTLSAFLRAERHGAAWLELDVQASRDGEAVVIHDTTLRRTTGLHARVRDLSLSELRRLDAGAWFGSEFAGEGIPHIADVFAAVSPRTIVDIEIKRAAARGHAGGTLLASLFNAIDTHARADSVIITSFSADLLARVRALRPDLRIGLLSHRQLFVSQLLSQLAALRAEFHFQNVLTLTKTLVQRLQDAGVHPGVFTANSPRALRHAREIGVEFVITDCLEEARGFFDAQR